MNKIKELCSKYNLSVGGVLYRQKAGIPLDFPKVGEGRGGNYSIDKAKAKAIWKFICDSRSGKKKMTQQEIADHFGVTRSCVSNIASGLAWNSVSGIEKRARVGE